MFYRDGGKPQIESIFEGDALDGPGYPEPSPAYSLIGELEYPANTEIATSSNQQIYSFTERAYSESYPTR